MPSFCHTDKRQVPGLIILLLLVPLPLRFLHPFAFRPRHVCDCQDSGRLFLHIPSFQLHYRVPSPIHFAFLAMPSISSLVVAALAVAPLLSGAVPLRKARAAAALDLTVLSLCILPSFLRHKLTYLSSPRLCQCVGEARDPILHTGSSTVPAL